MYGTSNGVVCLSLEGVAHKQAGCTQMWCACLTFEHVNKAHFLYFLQALSAAKSGSLLPPSG